MTNTAARNNIYTGMDARHYDVETERLHQAALAGERGVEAQLVAMSADYLAAKAAGRLVEAAAIKAAAIEISKGGK